MKFHALRSFVFGTMLLFWLTIQAALAAPVISSISPNPVPGLDGTQTITLAGSNFVSGCQVTLYDVTNGDGPYVKSTTYVSSSQIKLSANFTNNTATWSAQVTSPTASNTKNFTVQAAGIAPVISSISPSPVPGLDGSQTITISGSNFVSGCKVTLYDVTNGDGPYVKSVTYVSSSQIKVSANFTNNTATWSAQVTSPTASNTKNFSVQASVVAPVISSISPDPVPGLEGTQTITISGSNFVSGCTVTLKDLTNGGTYAKSVTYVSSSQIKVSANFTNNTATWSAQVTSPTASNTKNFSVQASVVAPVISSISPDPVPGLDGTQTITINGTNFVTGCTVTLKDLTNGGTYSKSTTYVSSSQIKVSANFTNVSATWSAQVTSPTSSNTKNFTVQATVLAPVISSISPDPVPGLDGTQTITINGTNFVTGCTVTLKDLTNGGTYAKSVTYVSSSQIKVSANFTNNTATWSAQVTSPTASNTKNFSVQASVVAPVISSISPDPVPGLEGTQTITISGSNFVSGCTVTLKDLTNGGTYAKSVTYVSSSQIKISANFTNNTATWSAQVTSPTTSNTKNFSVQASVVAPVISSISPGPVPGLDGTQTINISGSNFVSGCTVTLYDVTNGDGPYVKATTWVSATQIKISANFTNNTATWSAQVTSPTASNTKNFSVQASVVAPVISNVSPDPVPGLDGSQTITLTGTNFVSGCTVTLYDVTNGDGPYVKATTWVSATQIKISANFTNNTATWSAQVFSPTASNTRNFSVQATVVTPGSFTLSYDTPVWDVQSPPGPAMMLKWTKSANATTYDLYRNGTLYKSDLIGNSFYNSTGLASGQTYTFHLIAKNTIGQKPSNTITVGPMPGETPRPDLIIVPNSIAFSPSDLNVGGSFSLSFSVKNLGPGNAPATIARLRLSADGVLTKQDLPLSPLNVDIPALAPGKTHTFNGQVTVPPSTPKGTYYVGTFADADDSAGQSDVTNDSGISTTRLSTTAPGVATPVITVQPKNPSGPVNVGDTVELSVQAQGSGLHYQWMRYDNPVGNETSATLKLESVSASQSGDYWARVSNPGGFADSSSVSLTTANSTPTIASRKGHLIGINEFRPDLPTVIITHGWNRDGEYKEDKANLPSWMNGMEGAIRTRLDDTASTRRVNILLYTWSGAFSPLPWPPFSSTDSAGLQLANELEPLIGGTYSMPIHFIGHSFGTFVNAHAVEKLGIETDQFTILDAPINHEAQVFLGQAIGAYWLDHFFARHLKRGTVRWVDNYIATTPTSPFIFPFGAKVTGSFPAGGMTTSWMHETIQNGFYTPSIQGSKAGGFNDSVVINPAGLGVHLQWNPPPTFSELVSDLPDVARFAAGEIHEMADTAKGKALKVFRLVKGSISPQSASSKGIKATGATPPQDAVLEFDLSVPKKAQQLTFDFRFPQLGDGDWMTVSFNDNLLYNFLGKSFYGTDYHQAEIPIANFAGKTGVLTVALHSANATPSELRVANFKFMSEATGSLNVQIEPTAAVKAGAKWRVDNGSWWDSGKTLTGLSLGTHKVSYQSVSGWSAPVEKTVTIKANQTTSIQAVYSAKLPEIRVDQLPGLQLADGKGYRSFGKALLGKGGTTKKFRIKNIGSANLTDIRLSKHGENKEDFALGKLPKRTLKPGESMVFKVEFKPSRVGSRFATIRIASNDSSENPFGIRLKGAGKTKTGRKSTPLAELVLSNLGGSRSGLLLQQKATSSVTIADGKRYLTLTVEKIPGTTVPVVEVSPNLVDWYSGGRHTSILRNDESWLRVRDNVPVTPEHKRYIRVKPE